MSFPRHHKYKDSGAEWLGELPEHWQVKRLKRACHVFPSNVDKKTHDGETPVLLCNYTDVYYNETITAGMDFMAATASSDQIDKFTLRAGDTIITKDSETADDIAIGAYVPADLPGVVCGYHLSMVRPLPDTHGAFVKRLFDSTYAKSCFEVLANGLTRVGLGQYELDNVELPFPPHAEQSQIAAFLDRETAKIDELVAEQQRLMELLKEKRQAVISHAVTQGLNPHAPMRPSGIDWLGDMPAHWELKRLKYLGESIIGLTYSPADIVEEGSGTLVLRSSNVQGGVVVFDDNVYVSTAIPKELVTKVGDILICSRNGSRALIGKNATIDERAAGLTFGAFMTIFRSQHSAYLSCVLNSPLFEFQSGAFMTSTINQLTVGVLNNFEVPLPPADEREKIAAFLGKETAKFSTLTAEAQRAIDLLQERRTALISAAVTGQIDVRNT